MSKILLVGINARYTHSNPALYYLKKSIPCCGHDVSLQEFTISEKPEKILNEIIRLRPDLLALSVYIWNAEIVKSILKPVKRSLSDVKIVLGGPEVSYCAQEWVSVYSEIDCIITGEGERAFGELLSSLNFPTKKIIAGNNPHFSFIDFPYNSDDMERLKRKYIYYESVRGCPFRCSYCLSSVNGGNVQYKKIEQIKEELGFFLSYRPPLIKFIDRTFNLEKRHYLPVWEFIVEKFKNSGTCFHFEIFPELLDDEDIDFLAGVPGDLFQFEIGIQSVNSETLKAINRPGEWNRAERNIQMLINKGNIHLHVDLIAGLPYEGIDSYRKSFNSVYSLGAGHFQGGFLKVLPGTAMRRDAGLYGMRYDQLPPYEVIETKWISSDEILRLKIVSELVDLFHNSGRFNETERFISTLYGDPFLMYSTMSGFFKRGEDAGHREWQYLAEVVVSMIKERDPAEIKYLMDCLRWDWCTVMKRHHFPELLKSDKTIEAKRKGYRFFAAMPEETMEYYGIMFDKSDLRRSIFFAAESDDFKREKMKGDMAMFLPDKRVVFFDLSVS